MSAYIGKVLGQNYRIVEPIGAGAMGMVYVVEHVALKKRFAAKLLTADLARHPEAIARFEVEAHAASQLDHENIVTVIDYGKTDDGCAFLIMELLRGKTLQARMDQGTPTHEEIVAIIAQVCHALSAAHAEGIVHRDMKPENIFLTQRPGGRPVVKVLDFGISKARESSVRDGRITKQGQLLGSPEYMSPEASRGDEVDARADVYAVGIILYELLTGEVPFRHENYLKVLQMHANQQPRSPRELVPDMPEAVERLILRALEKDPDRRQASIEELEVELMAAMPEAAHRALLQTSTPSGPWLASSTNPMMFVSGTNPGLAEGSGTAHQASPPADTTLDTRRGGRSGVLWGVLLVAVVAAAALGGLRWYQGQRRAPIAAAPSTPIADGAAPAAAPTRAAGPKEPTRVASGSAAVAADPATPAAAPASAADPAPAAADSDSAAADPAPVAADSDSAAADPDSAGEPAASAARPGQVRLRIASTPSGAIATLGGRRLGRTPIDEWVDSSDQQAELELDLRGYRATSRSLTLDRDHDLRMTLRHDARRPSAAARRARNPDAGVERPPAADLDIKEGR